MKYLLDTHMWLWSLLQPENIDVEIVAILLDESNELFISPISLWEILILAEKGRIELRPSPEAWIAEALKRSPIKEAVLTHTIAIRSRSIDLPHQDPADRFIAATALVNDMMLLTADKRLRDAPQIATA